ncbi:hypothetical protein BDW02DRAFT_419571 [Decorospora gaudefroyi]|uniref:Uncharacterized protein n=1 Tax=Decorospora gaudefroyi TaxID=184978 RepID=A0A6A5KBQ8_9PLEO|nr:hypothetical protein BDW02DRAFT_419571 [Decorospora gaudefroyi]
MKLLVLLTLSLGILATALAAPPPALQAIAIINNAHTSNTTLIPPSNTPSQAHAHGLQNNKPTSTTTQITQITQTSRPGDPEPIFILPFHVSLSQSCPPNNNATKLEETRVTAIYTNGDHTYVYPNPAHGPVKHGVAGYPDFTLGPFDAQEGVLRFGYENGGWACEWGDDETWRVCGECRTKLWSGGCAGGGVRVSLNFLFLFLLVVDAFFGDVGSRVLLMLTFVFYNRRRRWIVRLFWGGRVSLRVLLLILRHKHVVCARYVATQSEGTNPCYDTYIAVSLGSIQRKLGKNGRFRHLPSWLRLQNEGLGTMV